MVGQVERRVLMIEFELVKEHSLREEWGVCMIDGPFIGNGIQKPFQNVMKRILYSVSEKNLQFFL